MNSDIEDLLREGMERFTGDVRAPAGMLRRASRRRHRQLALRSVAGVTAALAVGAVALVTVVLPGAGDSGVALAVVKRVDRALGAAEPGDIAQMTVTIRSAASPGGKTVTTTAEDWSYGERWRSVTYSTDGHPAYDEGVSATSVYTLVSYPAQVWTRHSGLGRPLGLESPNRKLGVEPFRHPVVGAGGVAPKASAGPVDIPRGCEPVGAALLLLFQPGLPGIGFSASSPPATAPRALRTAVSCGVLTVAGRQRVDGVQAIELTSRRSDLISETIWVSPGTYLPLRVVVGSVPGEQAFRLTADITWLAVNPRDLAKLAVPIPAGFRRVTLPEALGLTLLQKSPGQKPKTICIVSGGSGRQCVSSKPDGS
ncbi:MAG TPA: hypothetical protein VME44_21280 [Streptosporangiaceae bacterium]|nr:hypothetical protein [Streptosporangiaceae bacterium]